MVTATTNPSFEPPQDDSDNEIWLLRAPAHLDVAALLNGAKLDFDADPSASNNNILSKFTSSDGGSEYALTLGDANEVDNLRLLVPDKSNNDDDDSDDDDEASLIPHRAFQRQIHLTSVMSGSTGTSSNTTGDNIMQADLIVAPSEDNAPKPAFNKSGNGSVDTMRLAYVPVPQRQGLMRRWAMPGSKIRKAAPSALYSEPLAKKACVGVVEEEVIVSDNEPKEEETPKKVDVEAAKSSSKKKKKKDKKSEKKKKKSEKK